AVEQTMMNRLVTQPLGQRQPVRERRESRVIVALADQREPVEKEPEEERDEEVVLAGQGKGVRLQAGRRVELAGPVAHEAGRGEGEGAMLDVVDVEARRHRLLDVGVRLV